MSMSDNLPDDELSELLRQHGGIESLAAKLGILDPKGLLPAVAEANLGKAEIEFAASVTAPLFWVLRNSSGERIKNGSAFFLNTGEVLFAVTACHVVEECFADSKLPSFVQVMIGGRRGTALPMHLGDRLIDAHRDIDIATFRVTAEELEKCGHTALTGFQRAWPPRVPEIESGVTYSGFPGRARTVPALRNVGFGIFAAATNLTSVNEHSLSMLIEREKLVQVHGDGIFSEDYDFGGISGGPIIAIVQTTTIRSWIPAGVIIHGPNQTGDASQSIQGFEMIKARPVQYILPDGHLDSSHWEMSNVHRR